MYGWKQPLPTLFVKSVPPSVGVWVCVFQIDLDRAAAVLIGIALCMSVVCVEFSLLLTYKHSYRLTL